MKKVFYSLLTLMLVATIVCCDKSENDVQAEIGLKNFANTDCKGFTRDGSEDIVETIAYDVIHKGYLHLNHQNAIFNCCPGELRADITVEGHIITVSEYDTEQQCKCVCPYDLSYEIGPLTEGKTYTLSIGYKGQESIVAEFTFRNTLSGIWQLP